MKKLFALLFMALLSISSIYAQDCSIVKGKVWFDENADGIQNDNATLEPNGIKVYLYDVDNDIVAETEVDESGIYEFQVSCGTYYVKVDKGDYTYYSPKDVGDDDSIDSDISPETGLSETFDIADGETKVIDAGLNCGCDESASLSGKVWFDENRDGIQNANEKGVSGVTVYLLKDGERIDSTTTDSGGNYLFEGLSCDNGKYSVEIVKPNDYDGFANKNVGSDDSQDSDVDSNGVSDTIIIDECKEYTNVDAGLISEDKVDNDEDYGDNEGDTNSKTACIGDLLWLDKNLNGIQDSNEPVVKDAKVYLYDISGKLLQTTNTDNSGHYKFCGLKDGEYKVKFELSGSLSSYMFTIKDAGSDDTKDSDIDESGWSQVIIIENGEDNMSIDGGIYCSCDDYKVHPDRYDSVSAGVTLEMALGVLIFIFLATSSLKYKRD